MAKLEKQRLAFEYWSHAASYLPMADYRFTLPHKLYVQSGEGHWYKREPAVMQRLLDRIKAEGPLMSRDFEKMAEIDGPRHPKRGQLQEPLHPMDQSWVGDPVKRALRQLFMEGKVMVSSRSGFQKTYDLPERVLPPGLDIRMPARREYIGHLVDRYARTYGLFSAPMVGYLLPINTTEIQEVIDIKIEEGMLQHITVKGKGSNRIYLAGRKCWELFQQHRFRSRMHFLSPFDNFLIQRKRIQDLFAFNYTLECYVPAAKRKVGYFSLPVLYGDRFIAQIDLKAERNKSTLKVQNLVWEPEVKMPAKHQDLLVKKLWDFAAFNGCEKLELPRFLRIK